MATPKAALVLMELQNDFLALEGKAYPLLKTVLEENNVVSNLNALIRGARELGMPIIHTPIEFSEDYREMGADPYGILKIVKTLGAFQRGTWGAQIADSIDRHPSDIMIENKSGIDAFCGTRLDQVLRAKGITTIVLAGQLTHLCIESTMRSAYDKGYRVLSVTDATATIGMEQYRMSVEHNWPMFSLPVTHKAFFGQAARG
ncbi:cysteine hydrolase [Methyloversatilis sp. XJ19-13]|uniref:cysteine hydrolase family protein n=1 Tax=Methyloversatilis sp. XJ19-13 TaxID=2963430 RepID=UPI00211CA943|nr:isochorismatase family cysteine hydrolase [Methyloversatilis sp. XJ19-13]MCQ9375822.1 cysteine hydrolase [Methyloversatilis sp. XJ19-13]